MHRNNFLENTQRVANPYLNIDYKSLYDFDPEKEIFSNTKNTKIKSYAVQAKTAAQSN